ncbi:hypothetical protein DNTS_003335, partial [Danionella cerebrum]
GAGLNRHPYALKTSEADSEKLRHNGNNARLLSSLNRSAIEKRRSTGGMRRTKAEVERYISAVQSGSPAQRARPVKGFLFAKLYYEAEEYELAQRYIAEYLLVQPKDSKAHKFLGQLYERAGDTQRALGCYKRSVELNPSQPDLVLKVAELLCSDPVPDSRARFWVERATRLMPGHPVVFRLKERLLESPDQLLLLLQTELKLRPGDLLLHQRLVQFHRAEGRLEEAALHCLRAEENQILPPRRADWHRLIILTLQEYLQLPGAELNLPLTRRCQTEVLFAHCSWIRSCLEEKSCQESGDALWSFDCALQNTRRNRSDVVELLTEMRAQLYLFSGTLLLKRAQSGEQPWRAVRALAALCYTLAYQVPRPRGRGSQAGAQDGLALLACERASHAGHMLLSLSEDSSPELLLQELIETFGTHSGRADLAHSLYSPLTRPEESEEPREDRSFICGDDTAISTSHTPSLQELQHADAGAVLRRGGDLQALLWLALQQGNTLELQPWLRLIFPRLPLETNKLENTGAESICLLDLEVFVRGVLFCAQAELQQRSLSLSPCPNAPPRSLPLELMKSMSTDRQGEWWNAVCVLLEQRTPSGLSAKLRLLVQHGLNALRAGEKHGLQPALLIHWAQELSREGERVNSFYDQKDFGARSVHYWRAALPLLDKIRNRRSIPEPLEPLFSHYRSREIQPVHVLALEQEAQISVATLLDIEGSTNEAIRALEQIRSPSACWSLAKIYQRLAEEAGNEEDSEKHLRFLQQFRRYLEKILQSSPQEREMLAVPVEEVMDLLNDVTQQLEEDHLEIPLSCPAGFPQSSSPEAPLKISPSPSRRVTLSPKTPPHWAEDQKSLLQMLCQQVEALKNEVHELRHHSTSDASSSFQVYREKLSAEGTQENLASAQNLGGAPLTVCTTVPSVYYGQSPGYNSQYTTPTKGPVFGISRLPPQQHLYAHTPPLQSTPGCVYPQEQVFGGPLRFESPATSLLSPYSEEFYIPTVNPSLPEPGYFTKPSAPVLQTSQIQPGLSPQTTEEALKPTGSGAASVTPSSTIAFKFKSNFKSNDGDFTFSAHAKNSESLLGLLTSDSSAPAEAQPEPSAVFTFGNKSSPAFFSEGAQGMFGSSEPRFGALEKREDSDNDSTQVEEDEDGPHFEPIVPLPDKVDVKTGEEEEEEMFCKRAKLFRFDTESKEWKERGIGSIKILKHRTSGKVRLLMRREQVLKICANHYITTDMVLKPNAGSDKSWVWHAMDYADEMPKNEQLAIRFKTVDEATLFKARFEEAQTFLCAQEQTAENKAEELPKPQQSAHKGTDLKSMFCKKPGEWDCDVCSVRNAPLASLCVACNSSAPFTTGKEKPKTLTAPPAKLFSFGLSEDSFKNPTEGFKGLSFGSQIPASFKFGTSELVKKSAPAEEPQKPKASTVPAATVGFGSQFAQKEGQWDCEVCLVRNEVSATTCVSCSTANLSVTTKCPTPASSGLAAMFGKKEGQWDCDVCLVRNESSSTTCVSCQTPNSSVKMQSSTPSSSSSNFALVSAGSQPASTGFTANFTASSGFKFGTSQENTSSEGLKCGAPAIKQPCSAEFSLSMPVPAGGFKFGIESEPKETEAGSAADLLKNIADLHNEKERGDSDPASVENNPLISGKTNTFSFADLALSSQGGFQFGQRDPSFRGFTGAGEQLFSGARSSTAIAEAGDPDEDLYRTEDTDDIQFEPVVQMPDRVDLVTGEEDEQVLYSQRVKLFRFDSESSQWKERGVGNLKLLKNTQNGKLRVLMRREQVLKVCANHWITTTMNLKPLSGSDRAWMWMANDFSDGDARLEQLAAKFKSLDLAEEFRQKFEECQRLLLDIPLQTPHKLVNTGRTAQLIQKAEEMKSGLKDLKTFLTFQSKEDKSEVTSQSGSSVVVKLESESTVSALEWDNYDLLQENAQRNYQKPSTSDAPLQQEVVTKNLFRFGESSAGFNFCFQPALSPSKSPSKLNQSRVSVGAEEDPETSVEEERDGQYFEPVVPLPDLIQVSTGEEDEQVLFSHRAKLYRYDKGLSQWKERGIGDLKILQHLESKRVRLVMRRDQVLKLCANHWISGTMSLEPMRGAERAWVWTALDFTEGDGKVEQLAVRFKLQETANSFKEIFDQAKEAHEKGNLIIPALSMVAPAEQGELCGQAAISVLEETTRERSGSFEESKGSPEPLSQAAKHLVSPPKFVFGSEAMQKIFGSPGEQPSAPVSRTGGMEASRAKPNASDQMTPMTPFGLSAKMEQTPLTEDPDLHVVFEREPSQEQAELAERLQLPRTFFCYQNLPGYCSDPDDHDDEDYETAVRNLGGRLYPGGTEAQSDRDVECTLVWEKKATPQEEQRARRLLLPPTFLCGVSSESEAETESNPELASEKPKLAAEAGPTPVLEEKPRTEASLAERDAKPKPDSEADAEQELDQTPESRAAAETTALLEPEPESEPGADADLAPAAELDARAEPEQCSRASEESSAVMDLSTKSSSSEGSTGFSFASAAANSFSFADLAKSSEEFTFGKKDVNFTWSNAGAAVFGSTPKRTEEEEADEEEGSDEEAPQSQEIHFQPIVSLPEVEVRSGEEGEEVLFKEMCKLYRWDRSDSAWKERGMGELKILLHPERRSSRVLMRRNQVLKVCANHAISASIDLRPLNASANALVWTATDYSEGEPRVEQLAAKFKLPEMVKSFRRVFEQCQAESERPLASPDPHAPPVPYPSNPRVFFRVAVDGHGAGTLIMELFTHLVPRTAERFRALCTGERGASYKGTLFHRVIPEYLCEGGELESPIESLSSEALEDECFAVSHSAPGLLSMEVHSLSRFSLTLRKAEQLDHTHVALGVVREGMDLLTRLGTMGTREGAPTHTISISECGEM